MAEYTERKVFMLSPVDMKILTKISKEDGASEAAVLRRLIREEAKRRELPIPLAQHRQPTALAR